MNPDAPLGISIEPMIHRDIPEAMELEAVCFGAASRYRYPHVLETSANSYFVARHRGVVVGVAGLRGDSFGVEVSLLTVSPNYRRRKVGARLMLALCEEATFFYAAHISLEVRANNTEAISLYHKLGFEVVRRLPDYYTEPTSDGLLMSLEIPDPFLLRNRLHEHTRLLYPLQNPQLPPMRLCF